MGIGGRYRKGWQGREGIGKQGSGGYRDVGVGRG